jgi:hypothetical protein
MNSENEAGGSIDPRFPHIQIPEGKYICKYLRYETRPASGVVTPKLNLHFMVVQRGELFGVPLYRYYNLVTAKPPFGPGGSFTISPRGQFYRDYCRYFGAPKRTDRFAISKNFKQFDWTCTVRTVSRDFFDNEITPDARYSVIDDLLPYRRSGDDADE